MAKTYSLRDIRNWKESERIENEINEILKGAKTVSINNVNIFANKPKVIFRTNEDLNISPWEVGLSIQDDFHERALVICSIDEVLQVSKSHDLVVIQKE